MLPMCLQQSVSRKGATRWVWACGMALLGACAAPPEMAYPTGQGRQALNKPLATPQPEPSLAYDAPEIQRLSDALNQLQEQITEAQTTGRPFTAKRINASARVPVGVEPAAQPAAPPTSAAAATVVAPPSASNAKVAPTPPVKGVIQVSPAPDSKLFGLEATDTTLMGVLLRWAGQMGWLMRLNGYAVDGQRFPRHVVAYGDVALERDGLASAPAPDQTAQGGDALASAVAWLMQAHSHYQHQITVAVGFNPEKGELEVSSEAKTSSNTLAPAPAAKAAASVKAPATAQPK